MNNLDFRAANDLEIAEKRKQMIAEIVEMLSEFRDSGVLGTGISGQEASLKLPAADTKRVA